jgi:hypothetical protein
MAEATMSNEDIIKYLTENSEDSIEAQLAMAEMGYGYKDKWNQQAREDLLQAKGEAIDKYAPFREGGQYWLQQAKNQIEGGAPKYVQPADFEYEKYKGQDPFQYKEWKWGKDPYQSEGWDKYAKEHLGPENIEKSPFYDLYQWENEQQQKGIDQGLRARGMYGSGKGMSDALKAEVGLGERFAADEYGRAQQNYQMSDSEKWRAYQDEYEKALTGHSLNEGQRKDQWAMTEDQLLRGHNMGYGETLQKYGIKNDNYNKAFGVEQGQWTDKLNTSLGLGDYAWKAATGQANAALNTGSQLGTGAYNTGNAGMSLASQTGQGIGSTYNALGNQLGGVYGNTLNYGLGIRGQDLDASYTDQANTGNAWLGAGTLGVKAGTSIYDLYNKYNKPVAPSTPSSDIYFGDNSLPSTGYEWDTGEGAYW